MMMIPEAWGSKSSWTSAAPFTNTSGDDGTLGRPCGDGLHRRQADRRDPGPQRPAPGALHRHRRRPRRDGLRSRRAAGARGQDRQEVAAAARQDVPHRPRTGPDRRRRGNQAAVRERRPYREWIENGAIASTIWPPPGAAAGRRPNRCSTATGLRLHAGGPEIPARADGRHGEEAIGSMGTRHPAGRALRQAQAAVQLFQAELRPSHQPGDRLDTRGAGHEPRLVHRPAPQHPRPRRHLGNRSGLRSGQPILTNEDLERIRKISQVPFYAVPHDHARHDLQRSSEVPSRHGALARLAVQPRRNGGAAGLENIIVLSDREMGPDRIAIPSLLATSERSIIT